ncbi:MAG: hypothetical protein LBM62_08215 [Mediterranea sp.]|nr:hypothetical protein [Mediterranea sp.]
MVIINFITVCLAKTTELLHTTLALGYSEGYQRGYAIGKELRSIVDMLDPVFNILVLVMLFAIYSKLKERGLR